MHIAAWSAAFEVVRLMFEKGTETLSRRAALRQVGQSRAVLYDVWVRLPAGRRALVSPIV